MNLRAESVSTTDVDSAELSGALAVSNAPPLKGLRVLDLSRVLAGPFATQILADMGAEVIKIERPKEGDDSRSFPPFLRTADGTLGTSAFFLASNRGKRSITIDLTQPEGQELVRGLVEGSDILVENYKVGNLAKFGLDYPTLRARNPRLIYCSITGFGQTGPHRHRTGYDLVIEGMGGLMSITGERDGEPMKSGVAIVDILAALYATTAILAALHERERSNTGQHIDLALLDVQIASLATQAASYLVSGEVPERWGNDHASIVPYQVFQTQDTRIIVAVANDAQFERFSAILGMSHLAESPEFRTNADRVLNRETLLPLIRERLLRRTASDWLEELDRAQIPAGPINSLDSVFEDPQVVARNTLVEFPSATSKPVRVVGSPMHFSRTAVQYKMPPPDLGRHTEEVLAEILGKDEESLRRLRDIGAI